jgi:hypothetical protein
LQSGCSGIGRQLEIHLTKSKESCKMEKEKDTGGTGKNIKTNWVRYLLIALIFEKTIQHIFVTIVFYFNWEDIGSTVVVNPKILMILGAIVAVLFFLGLWGIIARKNWAINLIIALALFDIIGEFVAQGKIGIMITVSFIVAVFLLILSLFYRRQEKGD